MAKDIENLIKENNNLKKENKDLLDMIEQLKARYSHDFLTSIYNKNYYIENMEKFALQMLDGMLENIQNKNDKKTWSIIFCDINGLHLANCILGHVNADQSIKYIASIIKNVTRTKEREKSDEIIYQEKRDNIPIRFGGDEFLIILPYCTKENAKIIRERIKKHINDNLDKTQNMSLSFGIADTKEIPIPNDINEHSIKEYITGLVNLAANRMMAEKHKDIRSLSGTDQELVILKTFARAAEEIGLNITNNEDLNTIMASFEQLKSQKKNRIR